MLVAEGKPVTLSSDAHEPEHLGYGYDRAVELPARRRAWSEICVFERRAAREEPLG